MLEALGTNDGQMGDLSTSILEPDDASIYLNGSWL